MAFMPRFGWPDNTRALDHLRTREQRTDEIRRILDDNQNHRLLWLILMVAGSGFFTDSYNLFAVNAILPAIAYVWWPDRLDSHNETIINVLTLLGSIVGQLLFGVLADALGRTRLYGIELVLVIFSTAGVATSSTGFNSNMSIFALICCWRFVMGVGIGAEYPLSAVLTAEWAPTASRAWLLAAVFVAQPLGQLLAQVVLLCVLAAYSDKYQFERCASVTECQFLVDKTWRWVAGVGTIPCLVAIIFRFTIKDPGRWRLEVGGDGNRAITATAQANRIDETTYIRQRRERERAPYDPRQEQEAANGGQTAGQRGNDNEALPPRNEPREAANGWPEQPTVLRQQHATGVAAPPAAAMNRDVFLEMGGLRRRQTPNRTQLNGQGPGPQQNRGGAAEGNEHAQFSKEDLWNYLISEGNIMYLLGTSFTWFLLDFAYYGLGINNPRTIARLWESKKAPDHPKNYFSWVADPTAFDNDDSPPPHIYSVLHDNAVRSIYTVSLGSLAGSIAMVLFISYIPRRWYLIISFLIIAILLFITSGAFWATFQTGNNASVVLFALIHFFFNFGPNTLTFIIPAEIFPTRYRCTFHGIAAASGKLGSVIIQAALPYMEFGDENIRDPNTKGLTWVLIIFGTVMALAAPFAWAWLPELQHYTHQRRSWRKSNRTLEDLAKGVAAEREEGRTVGFRDKFSPWWNVRRR